MRLRAIDLEAFCSMFPLTLFMIMIISFVPQIDFYEQQGKRDTGVDDIDLHAAGIERKGWRRYALTKA
jgi:hypothetical protein